MSPQLPFAHLTYKPHPMLYYMLRTLNLLVNRMKKDTLIIGSYQSNSVDSCHWWEDLPNLGDYKNIILDISEIKKYLIDSKRIKKGPARFTLNKLKDTDEEIRLNLVAVNHKLIEIIEFDRTIYSLTVPNFKIWYKTGEVNSDPPLSYPEEDELFSTSDWCPINVAYCWEKGKSFKLLDDSYKQYFNNFKVWDFYFDFDEDSIVSDELDENYGKKWKISPLINIFATNNVNKALAFEFQPCFHEKFFDPEINDLAWNSVPTFYGGKLVLLPVFENQDTKPLIDNLLIRIGIFEETPPPNWVSKTEVFGEPAIIEEIDIKKHQIEALTFELESLKKSLTETQEIKGLLYCTGMTLQELVQSVLEKMGVKTKPSIVTDEFIIEIDGIEALIEVKGNKASILKDDMAQLVVDLTKHYIKTGKKIKGIFIGNGWRLEPPEERNVGGKQEYSRDAKEVAENHGIGLISTLKLFEIYCQINNDPSKKDELLKKMISTTGIFEL
jgi:hypothetical protein